MRLVADLEASGLIEVGPGGVRRAGLPLVRFAAGVLHGHDRLSAAQLVLDDMTQRTDLTSYLSSTEDGVTTFLLRSIPAVPLVSRIEIGSRVDAPLIAPGQAALDHLGAGGGAHVTWSHGGFEPGVDACAAVVGAFGSQAIAAISVAGPPERVAGLGEQELSTAVAAAAGEVERVWASLDG